MSRATTALQRLRAQLPEKTPHTSGTEVHNRAHGHGSPSRPRLAPSLRPATAAQPLDSVTPHASSTTEATHPAQCNAQRLTEPAVKAELAWLSL